MPTRSPLAAAIRSARTAVGLNQAQLARRVGVGARAVYRWERDESIPIGRSRSMLVAAIEVLNPQVAAQLAAALVDVTTRTRRPPPVSGSFSVPGPQAANTAVDANAVELVLLGMAEELHLPPRPLRLALQRAFAKLHAAGLSFDAAQRALAVGAAEPISSAMAGGDAQRAASTGLTRDGS